MRRTLLIFFFFFFIESTELTWNSVESSESNRFKAKSRYKLYLVSDSSRPMSRWIQLDRVIPDSTDFFNPDLQIVKRLGPSHCYHTTTIGGRKVTIGGMRVALLVSNHRCGTGSAPKMKNLHSSNGGFRVSKWFFNCVSSFVDFSLFKGFWKGHELVSNFHRFVFFKLVRESQIHRYFLLQRNLWFLWKFWFLLWWEMRGNLLFFFIESTELTWNISWVIWVQPIQGWV